MYKYYGAKVETRPISIRLRRDILDWFEMEGINKNAFINDMLFECVKECQWGHLDFQKWRHKNR